MTGLSISVEWNSYARNRKALRVTQPHGIQRSSYFLSLPFRYGVPLTICSGILHWLLSESVFLVYPTTYNCAGDIYIGGPTKQPYLGFSFIAIVTTIAMGAMFIFILVPLGWFQRLDSLMPLAGSDSRAIASACFRPDEDVNAHIMPVQYGALPKIRDDSDEPQHCSFTTATDVELPQENRVYV